MATLTGGSGGAGGGGGRITLELVEQEIRHLQSRWQHAAASTATGSAGDAVLTPFLSVSQIQELDRFDRVQLEDVLRVCRESPTLSEAGRTLFAASRRDKKTPNDADRLRKYLVRFGLSWQDLKASA
jgi:transcriptional regulatory protein RtcR